MKKPLLIVDSNYIGSVAKYSMLGFSWGEIQTGVIFGFLRHVRDLAQRFSTDQFVFCWDGTSKTNFRRNIYPSYKIKRHTKERTTQQVEIDRSAEKQFVLLYSKILPQLGFVNNYLEEGYEGDDLLASIVLYSKWKGVKIIVASDEDFYQLLTYADMWKPLTKVLYTRAVFEKEWGIRPSDWTLVKAIGGCSGDSVTGIEGVAEKTAAKYLRGELCKGIVFKKLNKETVDRFLKVNLPLVKLPFVDTPKYAPVECSYKMDPFLDIFDQYGFRSFSNEFEKWKSLFNMRR